MEGRRYLSSIRKNNELICGEALSVLKTLSTESIDLIVTSPPYYSQRDYKVSGQIGLEPTPQEYINRLSTVFNECKRILKKTGSLWLNIADTYASGGGKAIECSFVRNSETRKDRKSMPDYPSKAKLRSKLGKSLLSIPELLVSTMTYQSYWIRRNTIIWQKTVHMPPTAKDRFVTDFEYFYFFVKQKKYYYNDKYEPEFNKSIWNIPPKPYKGAHFATFPERLVETPIMFSCPEDGMVLDPFCGSGTVCVVAKKLNRNYIGIDINPEFIEMTRKRLLLPSKSI